MARAHRLRWLIAQFEDEWYPSVTLHRNALSFKLIVRGYYIVKKTCPAGINGCTIFAILIYVIDAPYILRLWRKGAGVMSDRYLLFEVFLKQRGRGWLWEVCTTEGALVMMGSRGSRSAASYEANRALFLLLSSAPHLSRLSVSERFKPIKRLPPGARFRPSL